MKDKSGMQKVYEKPRIAIENFVVNQFIAGSCQVKIRGKEKDEWYEELDLFTRAAIDLGQFAGELNCTISADDDNDSLCYHTQGSPLFLS